MPAIGTDASTTALGALARGGAGTSVPVASRGGVGATTPAGRAADPASGRCGSGPPAIGEGPVPTRQGPGEQGADFLRALEDALAVVLRMQARESLAPGARGSAAPAASAEALGFQAVVEVRNRLMAAYHEIMSMNV